MVTLGIEFIIVCIYVISKWLFYKSIIRSIRDMHLCIGCHQLTHTSYGLHIHLVITSADLWFSRNLDLNPFVSCCVNHSLNLIICGFFVLETASSNNLALQKNIKGSAPFLRVLLACWCVQRFQRSLRSSWNIWWPFPCNLACLPHTIFVVVSYLVSRLLSQSSIYCLAVLF